MRLPPSDSWTATSVLRAQRRPLDRQVGSLLRRSTSATSRRFRGATSRLLEIGISHGGSLQMWRQLPRSPSDDRRCRHRRAGGRSSPNRASTSTSAISPTPSSSHVDRSVRPVRHRHRRRQPSVPPTRSLSLEFLWPQLRTAASIWSRTCATSYWPEYEGGSRRTRHVHRVRQGTDRSRRSRSTSRQADFEPTRRGPARSPASTSTTASSCSTRAAERPRPGG